MNTPDQMPWIEVLHFKVASPALPPMAHIHYVGDDPAQNDVKIAAVREYYKEMEPYLAGYYNNLNEESEQKTWGNYGANYPRLVELKNKYDPGNLFRLNANIKPG